MSRPNNGTRLERNHLGFYEIRWTEKGRSKRISTRTNILAVAEEIHAKHLTGVRDAEKNKTTIAAFLDAYWNEWVQEQVMDKDRIADCMTPLRAHFGTLSLCDLANGSVATYKADRASGKLGRPAKDATIRRELVTLVAALNHAVRQRRVRSEEVPHIPMPPASPPREFWLNEREEEAFLALAESTSGERLSRVHRFVAIALDTAARRKSIETLRWDQVDLDAKVIRYQADGRRQKKKRRVPVPISDRLLPLLERAYRERTGEYVLGTPYSIQHQFEALIARAIKEIGPKFQYLTIHDLRRTWATLAARAGVDLFQIAGVLGDTFATVERVYAHHSPDHLRTAINFRRAPLSP